MKCANAWKVAVLSSMCKCSAHNHANDSADGCGFDQASHAERQEHKDDTAGYAWSAEDLYGAPVEGEQEEKALSFKQKLKRLPKFILVKCIRFYQQGISPLFPPTCRYVPSCSQYAIIAIQRYGLVKGGWLATKRVLRCHPWHAGGYDPVP